MPGLDQISLHLSQKRRDEDHDEKQDENRDDKGREKIEDEDEKMTMIKGKKWREWEWYRQSVGESRVVSNKRRITVKGW